MRKNNTGKTYPSSSKLNIGLAMATHATSDLYPSFIIGLIPVLTLKFNLSLFLVSILTSVTGISNSLTQPIFGYLSDKYNYKYFLVTGLLFSAVFISIMPVMPTYFLVLIMIFLGNLGVSSIHPPTAAVGGKFGGRLAGFANSIISFAGTFGYAIGSFLIIIIVEKIGIKFSPITMIIGIITAILLLKYFNIPKTYKHQKTTINFFKKLKLIEKHKLFKLILLFTASYARDLMWGALTTFMPLYFTGKGITLINIGTTLLLYTIAGGLGGIVTGFISDRIKNKTILIQAGLLLSVPFIFFIFRTNGIIPLIFFIISGFFSIGTLPVCIRVSQDIFPSNISLASSLVMGFSVGIASITMIFLGKTADIVGIQTTIEYIIIINIIIAVLITLYLLNPGKLLFYKNKI